MADLTLLYFDGACEEINPGGLGTWGYIVRENAHGMKGRIVYSDRGVAGSGPGMTNNIAEYMALGHGLRWLVEQKRTTYDLQILGDSKLVINQVLGNWNCNADHLVRLRDRCRELLQSFPTWSAKWIPREENEGADRLTRQVWEDTTGKPFPHRPTKRRRLRGMQFKGTGRGEG